MDFLDFGPLEVGAILFKDIPKICRWIFLWLEKDLEGDSLYSRSVFLSAAEHREFSSVYPAYFPCYEHENLTHLSTPLRKP